MTCPKCRGQKLEPVVVDGTEVDRCPACGGVWFDKGELGQTLRQATKQLGPLVAEGSTPAASRGPGAVLANDPDRVRGACPRDQRKLLAVESARCPELTVDQCSICGGIWLDGGELTSLRLARPGVRLGDLV
jgi:Zn-finger nucleic acid-binding protein